MMYTVYFSTPGYAATTGNWHDSDTTLWNEQPISGSLSQSPDGKKHSARVKDDRDGIRTVRTMRGKQHLNV